MRFFRILLLCLIAGISCAKAQMGYQISLLNTATGEPRANETVTVSVSLSNNDNEVFYSETKSATTNDFGVLSLSIGNADTFKDVDLSKMPFFIEVTANGVMIGKSQMLSVPVAEVAKRVAPIDKNLILGSWKWEEKENGVYYTFCENGIVEFRSKIRNNGIGDFRGTLSYVFIDNVIRIFYSEDALTGDGYIYPDNTFFFQNGILYSGHNNRVFYKSL